MLVGLGERFGQLPTQIRDGGLDNLRYLNIIAAARPEQREAGPMSELSPEMRAIVEDKAQAQELGLG